MATGNGGGDHKRSIARTALQIESDNNIIIPLFLSGLSYEKITAELNKERGYNLKKITVMRDIQRIIDGWHKDRLSLIDKQKTIILNKIHKVEAAAWEAWEESRKPKKKKITKGSGVMVGQTIQRSGRVFSETHTQESEGGAKWLDIILRCQAEAAEIMGMKNSTVGLEIPPGHTAPRTVVFGIRSRNATEYTEAEVVQELQDITQKQISDGN